MQLLETYRRDAELLLRELEATLTEAHLSFRNPATAAARLDGKFRALYRKIDQEGKATPTAKVFCKQLRDRTEKQRVQMVNHAKRSFVALPRNPSLKDTYNGFIGSGVAQLPGATTQAANREIDKLVGKLVEGFITDKQVSGSAKAQISKSLAEWVKQQETTQDALYHVQGVLMKVSGWLHEKLTIRTQIKETRDAIQRRKTLTPEEAKEADRAIGVLGQRSQALDKSIEEELRRNGGVQTFVRLRPKLVLDPAKAFLGSVELRAGIKMRPNGIQVDLSTGIKVVDPLSPDRYEVNAQLNIQPSDSLNLNFQGGSTRTPGKGWQHSVKANLSWSF